MPENHADQLDGDKLGEGIGDDGLPGVGDYPPETAQGVNDPNLVASDDVATREARTRSEEVPGHEQRPGDIVPPAADQPGMDAEQQLIADGSTNADNSPTPAEVAALRETDDPT